MIACYLISGEFGSRTIRKHNTENVAMKSWKIGLLCLALSAIAGPAIAGQKGNSYSYGQNKNVPTVSVPEPGPLSLLAAGMVGVAAIRRFKK